MEALAVWLLGWGLVSAVFVGLWVYSWYADREATKEIDAALRRYYAGEFPRRQKSYGPDGKPWPWEKGRSDEC